MRDIVNTNKMVEKAIQKRYYKRRSKEASESRISTVNSQERLSSYSRPMNYTTTNYHEWGFSQ